MGIKIITWSLHRKTILRSVPHLTDGIYQSRRLHFNSNVAAQPHFAPNAEQNQVSKIEYPWKQLVVPFSGSVYGLELSLVYSKCPVRTNVTPSFGKCQNQTRNHPAPERCKWTSQLGKPYYTYDFRQGKPYYTYDFILSGDQGSTYGMFSHSSHKLLLWDCNQIKVTS